jgi:hypothetical protein
MVIPEIINPLMGEERKHTGEVEQKRALDKPFQMG